MAHEPTEETALPVTGGGRRPEHPVDERRSPGPEADLSFGERLYLREAIKGMVIIANHFFRNVSVFLDPVLEVMERHGAGVNLVPTISYLEVRKAYPPGY